jgi:hypothetical protein
MILNQETNDVLVFGEDTSKKAKISEDKLAKLQYLLTKGLYKDPISAVIVEWTNNGVDGTVQAGKSPIDHPVVVSIGTDKDNKMFFSVKDTGIGLDNKDFEEVCMNYLESTKENDNDTIGHFGLGMKSFLSLERPATFTCIKNGVKRKYLVYEGVEFVNYELIHEEETQEESGVECKIYINDWQEKNLFIAKAKNKLAYYDTVALIIDNVLINNKISRLPLFQWSTLSTSTEVHICLKDVVYAIDWEALGISRIDMPIALRFGLDSGMKPTPSRESYITNEATKRLILNRIQEVANYMVEKYNETVKEPKPFFKALPDIGTVTKELTIDDRRFVVNNIMHHATVPVENMKVEGLTLYPDGQYYKNKVYMFGTRYRLVGQSMREWKTKRVWDSVSDVIARSKYKVVKVSEMPIGRVRTYLREKYDYGTMFVVIKKPHLKRVINEDVYYSYKDLLNLKSDSKGKWREQIKEWQYVESLFDDYLIDELNVKNSPEFAQWLIDQEEAAKEFKRLNPTWRNPKSLNKQDGDITLAISRPSERNGIVYERKAYPIRDLRKLPYMVLYGFEEKKEWMERFQKRINKNSINPKAARIQTCIIGKREITKLPQLHNFISMDEFLSKGNKQFRQIVTAELISDAVKDYNVISQNLVANKYLIDLRTTIEELELYVRNFHLGLDRNEDVYKSMMAVADEGGLWDATIMPSLKKLLDNIEVLRFVSYLKPPPAHDEVRVKEFTRVVNQFILFKKLHGNQFDNYELVKTIEPEPIIEDFVEEGNTTPGESAIHQIFDEPVAVDEELELV